MITIMKMIMTTDVNCQISGIDKMEHKRQPRFLGCYAE